MEARRRTLAKLREPIKAKHRPRWMCGGGSNDNGDEDDNAPTYPLLFWPFLLLAR